MKWISLLESFGSLLVDFINDFIVVAESSYKYFWELLVVRSVFNQWELSPVQFYICYMVDKGKSSFLQNIVEETRPGCRNLKRSQIMVNLSEIFLVGMMLKSRLVCGFKDMGWTRISSADMGEGCCYWWDVAKHRIIE